MNPVEQTIALRKTSKVLLPIEHRHAQQALWTQTHDDELRSMLTAASQAPFHKRCHEQFMVGEQSAPMPWRFYVVGPQACTEFLTYLEGQSQTSDDPKWARAWQSKIKEMVAGCGVLVQATWLPDPSEADTDGAQPRSSEFSLKNVEHVAAAASAVQSLLISAQSNGWLSYWSSGGILRDADVFEYLGIDTNQQLLGSLFLTPEAHSAARIIAGGLCEQRGELDDSVRWINR